MGEASGVRKGRNGRVSKLMGGYWVGGSEGSLRGWHVGCKRGEAVGDEAREESRGRTQRAS